jgi:subtilisin family serine protease
MTHAAYFKASRIAIPLLLCACGGDKTTEPPPPPTVATVQVTPGVDTLKALGATRQFQAAAKDAGGGTIAGRTFTWTSADTMVARVDQAGLATAVRNGTATIQATTDAVNGTASLAVAQKQTALAVRTQPAGAAAGQPLTTQPVIEVRDAGGNVATNDNTTVVTATIGSGGGSLLGTATATAAAGIVTFTNLTVGGTVGSRTLAFSAPGLASAASSGFSLDPGPASQLSVTEGNGQTALAATALPQPLSSKVADAYGNGVPSATVAWTVTSGSGTLSAPSTPTNASGVASVTYTLGRFAGTESVQASATGLSGSPVTFSATATPNGTISGTVTLSNALLAPPATTAALTTQKLAERIGARGGPTVGLSGRKAVSRMGPALATQQLRPPNRYQPEYVPHELVVTLRPQPLGAPGIGSLALASSATAQTVARTIRTALTPHEQSGRAALVGVSPTILAARIRVPDSLQLESVAAELRGNPAVATVERNPIVRLDHSSRRSVALAGTAVLPNDPYYPYQAWHYAMIDAPDAWQVTTGSSSALVAVVDDGIRFDHSGIAANLTSDGYDFVSNVDAIPVCTGGTVGNAGDGDGYDADPTNPGDVVMDPDLGCISGLSSSGNHGLHVAGTVGAVGNDGAGGSGVSWQVRIRPVRVIGLNGGTNYDIAQGILYAAGLPADNGASGTVQAPSAARIINLSLGGPASSTVLENAVTSASSAGALLIAAAGNDAVSDPMYPAAYTSVVSVSALGPDGQLASYSNYGTTIDIAAPGGDVADGDATFGVWSTAWNYVSDVPIWDGSQWNGTSMAAPHVSGVAALLLARESGLTASQLRDRLLNYAVDIGVAGPDNLYGSGLLNARNTLTQTLAPSRQLYLKAFDAATGGLVRTTVAATDGSYALTELSDGQYLVYAGQDADGDQTTAVPLRRWGASGGTAAPTAVTVSGAGTYATSFTIGLPVEAEANNDFLAADALPVGGYVIGFISTAGTDVDVYRVLVPASGQFTFETRALDGACGFAMEEDTYLQLYNSLGSLVTGNDDIDQTALNYCSRISTTLSAGTYYIAVQGWNGGGRRYAVLARSGG